MNGAVTTLTPNDTDDYAAREKKVRSTRFTWAQNQIQTEYERYGLTDDFLGTSLYWYLAFQAAWRLPNFHEISSRSLVNAEVLLAHLPSEQQDRVANFYLQLAWHPTDGLRAKWTDQGTPIYHWLNRAFKIEWANLKATTAKDGIRFVSITDDENSEVQNLSNDDHIEAPESVVERERRENALVWNEDHKAWVRANSTRLHPGFSMGRPLWEALRAAFGVSEYHTILAESLIQLGRDDYSKIARQVNEAGFNISHDKVRYDIRKIKSVLKAVKNSHENKRSKRNATANTLPYIPTEIPPELKHVKVPQVILQMDREAANKKWDQTYPLFLRGTSNPITLMDPAEFDRISNNRLVFATTRADEL